MNDKYNFIKNLKNKIQQDIDDKQDFYDECKQLVEGPDLTGNEKETVFYYLIENWIQDNNALKHIKSIEEIYDFIYENENRWPKFMRSVKSLNKCLIDDTNIKEITLEMPFQWKGEDFVFCYTPGEPFATFFIKSDLESFFTIRPGSKSSQSKESIEKIEKKKQIYDEIIKHLDEVCVETLNYVCEIDIQSHSFTSPSFKIPYGLDINEKEWFYFEVDHKMEKTVCCKILDELEKGLE